MARTTIETQAEKAGRLRAEHKAMTELLWDVAMGVPCVRRRANTLLGRMSRGEIDGQ